MNNKENNNEKSKVTRRQFLGIAWLTTVTAFVGQTLVALFKYVQPVAAGGFGAVINAGNVDSFKAGSVTLIQKGRFYLHRLDDGSFIALWQRCTHLGCIVPWNEAEDKFHCPCHGSLFSKVGIVEGGPAPRPMDYFSVTVENGEVLVDTGNPTERKAFDASQTTAA